MSKAVMISIQPRWCELIANGEKTIEVRKTRPKLETPFKCYIYCTAGDDKLWIADAARRKLSNTCIARLCKAKNCGGRNLANGKILGEFVCDKVYELAPLNHAPDDTEPQACLSREEIVQYLKGRGWGWHISDLKIYDKPRKLDEFERLYECDECTAQWASECNACHKELKIKRPPQSWRYVEEYMR